MTLDYLKNMAQNVEFVNQAYIHDEPPEVIVCPKQVTFDEIKDEITDCSSGYTSVTANSVSDENSQGENEADELKQDESMDSKKEEEEEYWNPFRIVPQSEDDGFWDRYLSKISQVAKVFTYFLFFVCVFGASLVSKSTLALITSNMRDNLHVTHSQWVENVTDVNTSELIHHHTYVLLQENHASLNKTRHCHRMNSLTRVHTICDNITMRWIWAAILIICIPEVVVFLRSLWKAGFKKSKAPLMDILLLSVVVETLHSVGISLLVLQAMPCVESIHGLACLLSASVIPAIVNAFRRPPEETNRIVKLALDIAAILIQMGGVVVWPVLKLHIKHSNPKCQNVSWSLPLSLLLISIRYWQNYVDKNSRFGPFTEAVLEIKERIQRASSTIYMITSLWKIGITLTMAICLLPRPGRSIQDLFNFNFDARGCGAAMGIPRVSTDWVWVVVTNVLAGLVVYLVGMMTMKTRMQRFGCALPLVVGTPAVVFTLVGLCDAWGKNHCSFQNMVPTYTFFNCYVYQGFGEYMKNPDVWIMIGLWISQLWITRHVWIEPEEKLERTENLFSIPLWNGVNVEQHMLHNRKPNGNEAKGAHRRPGCLADEKKKELSHDSSDEGPMKTILKEYSIPFVYLCATMWHETREEMIKMLTSIYRLDEDQAARHNAREHLKVNVPDFYKFEAHIFFDDAYEFHGSDDVDYKVNKYVKDLVDIMTPAGKVVHGHRYKAEPPRRYVTPYGGRLEWSLPGQNRVIAHLKDKVKIRHKKRWSQCMYMYYMLGHRLMGETKGQKVSHKQVRADNTFLLALDGDVDFHPRALLLLVDLMKKDPMIAAACGRIHPIGSGPMVWYQKFEYALGHWMQKATEHVFGCVLCSPGCFSLFRGSALMDDNVMKMYTTKSTEAKHYVQYDQGEDRWLCTLLLQQGYRVEYCAASDALTNAPEAFNEFYNQRRRWSPSTMANIIDLLASWRQTTKVNNNISLLYIIYQAVLFISSMLGPGTIFLMIVGAMQAAFGRFGLDMWTSLFINLAPVLLFILLCFVTKSSTQLVVAQILTTLYSVIQMLVLIGIAMQMRHEGPCSPTGIFFYFVGGTFIIAAILHPQEFSCLFHGLIYFLSIPSMYMLLIIYGLTNMNNVSWGTREDKPVAAAATAPQQPSKAAKKGLGQYLQFVQADRSEDEGFTFSVGDLCRCVCCPRPKRVGSEYQALLSKLDEIHEDVLHPSDGNNNPPNGNNNPQDGNNNDKDGNSEPKPVTTNPDKCNGVADAVNTGATNDKTDQSQDKQQQMAPPGATPSDQETPQERCQWIHDPDLLDGPEGKLPESETEFFKKLIVEYLMPIESNKQREAKVAAELKDLRNKASFAFLLMNAIFVVVVFTLQIQKSESGLSIPWPCGDGKLELEPIGFVFLAFYAVIMSIQIIGMLVHRLGTYFHIMATTDLACRKKVTDVITEDTASDDAVELAKELGRAGDTESEGTSEIPSPDGSIVSVPLTSSRRRTTVRRNKTMRKLHKGKRASKRPMIYGTIEARFKKRLKETKDMSKQKPAEEILDFAVNPNSSMFSRRKSLRAIMRLQDRPESMLVDTDSEMSGTQNTELTPDV